GRGRLLPGSALRSCRWAAGGDEGLRAHRAAAAREIAGGPVTARRDPLIGTVLNDRYRIDAKIARGGMAMVYRGTDLRLDREIAIMVMHEHLISDETSDEDVKSAE